jgi:hypothetical protein
MSLVSSAGQPTHSGPPRSQAPDVAGAIALIAIVLSFATAAVVRRPDLTSGEWFLFADQGMNLLFTERLLQGGALYSDVAYPYGPLSAYSYAALAFFLDPSILSYHVYFTFMSAVAVLAAYALFRGAMPPPRAFALVVLAFVPTMLAPGSLLGGTSNSPYVALERILLLSIALAWTPPSERTVRRAALIGALLVAWQLTKFGGAFVAGAAIVLLDLLALHTTGWTTARAWAWIRSGVVTLLAFVAGEAIRVGYVYATTPRTVASEVLWPVHVLQSYRMYPAWAGGLHFADWRLVVGQYLTPLFGAALAIGFVALLLARRRSALPPHDWRWLRFLLPPLFFALAALGYSRQTWHFEQTMWTLAVGTALIALLRSRWQRRVAPLMLVPCFLLVAKAMFLNPRDAALVAHQLPNGERLMLQVTTSRQVTEIVQVLRPGPGAAGAGLPAVFVVPAGGGLSFFYRLPAPVRQTWYIPGFVRPDDESRMRLLMSGAPTAFVVRRYGRGQPASRNPCEWVDPPAFSPGFCAELRPRLSLLRQVDGDLSIWVTRSSERAP